MHLVTHLTAFIAVIDPGQGTQPPGTAGINKLVSWVAWGALVCCVVGMIAAGGKMALAVHRGDGGEHVQRLGLVLIGSIIVGAASGLVGAVA